MRWFVLALVVAVWGGILVVLLARDGAASSASVPRNLPSHVRTPGWGNPEVSQENIAQTICAKGWTATIRPPYSYTSFLKTAQIRYWKLPGASTDYEEDHFIPLELGGSPFDTRNLWPESWAGANASDPLENDLHTQVCSGQISLRSARLQIKAWKQTNG